MEELAMSQLENDFHATASVGQFANLLIIQFRLALEFVRLYRIVRLLYYIFPYWTSYLIRLLI